MKPINLIIVHKNIELVFQIILFFVITNHIVLLSNIEHSFDKTSDTGHFKIQPWIHVFLNYDKN